MLEDFKLNGRTDSLDTKVRGSPYQNLYSQADCEPFLMDGVPGIEEAVMEMNYSSYRKQWSRFP